MAIRIEAGLVLVWRDPNTLQLGLDPPRALVPVPTTAQERFLCGLREPVERDRLAVAAARTGCGPGEAAAVLGAASPALVDDLPERPRVVEVVGDGAVADLVATMLRDEGLDVVRTVSRVRTGGGDPDAASRTPVAAVPGEGVPADDAASGPTFAVLVADHVTDPEVRTRWSRRGIPHLPVVVGDGRVRIGPVVRGEDGPCLQCLELHRVDDDPGWPTLAAQVWGRPAPPLGAYRAAAVGVHVVRTVLAHVAPSDGSDRPVGQALVDRADLSVAWRVLPAHPSCGCRALPGTGSGPARRRGSNPDATTSP